MNANGTIYLTQNKGALTVPIDAVFNIAGKSYVMLKSDMATIEKLKKDRKYIDVFNTTNVSSGRSISSSENVLKKYVEYFSTTIPTLVEIGINTDANVEITSGIKANDIVVMPPLAEVSKGSSGKSGKGLGGLLGGNVLKVPKVPKPKAPKPTKTTKAGGGNK